MDNIFEIDLIYKKIVVSEILSKVRSAALVWKQLSVYVFETTFESGGDYWTLNLSLLDYKKSIDVSRDGIYEFSFSSEEYPQVEDIYNEIIEHEKSKRYIDFSYGLQNIINIINVPVDVGSSGCVLLGGQALIIQGIIASGGAEVSGEAVVDSQINIGNGPLVVGGYSEIQCVYDHVASGGVQCSGNYIGDNIIVDIDPAGVSAAGTAFVYITRVNVGSGGAELGGEAFVEYLGGGMTVDAVDVTYTPIPGGDTRTVFDKLQETISVKDFGALGNGTHEDGPNIQAAIDWAASTLRYNKTITFPCGIYKVTGTINIPQGIMLRGEGSQGSTDRYGVVIRHYGNTDCFHFFSAGTAEANSGTGGGLENMLILKYSGTGGIAIHVESYNDSFRPGEMMFTNILVYAAVNYWNHCFYVDGTASNVSGNRGVRTINMRKVRLAEVNNLHQTMVLNQVSHFYAHGIAIDRGSGAGIVDGGITLMGINDGVYLNALGLVGGFVVVPNDANNFTRHLNVDGKIVGSFQNDDTQLIGAMRDTGFGIGIPSVVGSLINRSKSFKIISDIVPYFLVKQNNPATYTNVTGNGDIYPVNFDTTTSDLLDVFATNNFTCVCAGTYHFDYCVTLSGLTSSHNSARIGLVRSSTSNHMFYQVDNPYARANPSGLVSYTGSCTIDLDYGDTVYLEATVSGGAKVVGIYGASTNHTWFSGRYIA